MIGSRRSLLLIAIALTIASSSCLAPATAGEEQVVGQAVDAIDRCYHWAGEVGDQSEERNAEIAEGIRRDCPIARQVAADAYARYPKNAELAARILQLIDIGYFDAGDDRRTNVCEAAYARFERDGAGPADEDVVFRAVCPDQAARLYGR